MLLLLSSFKAAKQQATYVESSLFSSYSSEGTIYTKITNNLQFLYISYSFIFLAEGVKQQIELAERFMSTLEDLDRKKQISGAIERLKKTSPRLLGSMKDVLANPKGIYDVTTPVVCLLFGLVRRCCLLSGCG